MSRFFKAKYVVSKGDGTYSPETLCVYEVISDICNPVQILQEVMRLLDKRFPGNVVLVTDIEKIDW